MRYSQGHKAGVTNKIPDFQTRKGCCLWPQTVTRIRSLGLTRKSNLGAQNEVSASSQRPGTAIWEGRGRGGVRFDRKGPDLHLLRGSHWTRLPDASRAVPALSAPLSGFRRGLKVSLRKANDSQPPPGPRLLSATMGRTRPAGQVATASRPLQRPRTHLSGMPRHPLPHWPVQLGQKGFAHSEGLGLEPQVQVPNQSLRPCLLVPLTSSHQSKHALNFRTSHQAAQGNET